MSGGEYEGALRARYAEARSRLMRPSTASKPQAAVVPVALPPPPEPPRAEARPRVPVVVTCLRENFPIRWIRELVIEMSDKRGVPPLLVAGSCQWKKVVAARNEIFDRLHTLGVSAERMSVMFNKDHTTVLYGIRRHRGAAPWKIKQSSWAYRE